VLAPQTRTLLLVGQPDSLTKWRRYKHRIRN
jgi:hypothetical protein